jgi:hypothetical protein
MDKLVEMVVQVEEARTAAREVQEYLDKVLLEDLDKLLVVVEVVKIQQATLLTMRVLQVAMVVLEQTSLQTLTLLVEAAAAGRSQADLEQGLIILTLAVAVETAVRDRQTV